HLRSDRAVAMGGVTPRMVFLVVIVVLFLVGFAAVIIRRRWRGRERRLFPFGRRAPGRFLRRDLPGSDAARAPGGNWQLPVVPENASAVVAVSGAAEGLPAGIRLSARGRSTTHALPWQWRGCCLIDSTPRG